jgi:membrane-associated phospholipid phosphatase
MAAWGFASGGPVALDASSAYGPWLDRLYAVPGLMTTEMHAALLETYRTGQFVPFGGISAMPSMHVGGIVLVAIVAWRRWRPLGAACWGYAGVIQIGSVVLGWHYAIDGYAGALLAWGCWRIAGRWRDARTGVDSRGERSRGERGCDTYPARRTFARVTAGDLADGLPGRGTSVDETDRKQLARDAKPAGGDYQ